VAGKLGYCGWDRHREPLAGDEIRPCWEAADATDIVVPALPGVGPVWPLEPGEDRTAVPSLQFVEVQPTGARTGQPSRKDRARPIIASASTGAEPRWSLWGEAEA